MSAHFEEEVLAVDHWTDRLFSFSTTRDPTFRFRNGQFVMLGLPTEDGPLLRAYSIASPDYDDRLGFFSIKAPDGPLTSRLQTLSPGDTVLIGRKPTGTLLLDSLKPAGRNLYLLSTGTGIAPFVATIADPRTYEDFERVVLVQGCRIRAELAYGERIVEVTRRSPMVGDAACAKLAYFPTVTREPFAVQGRVTDLFRAGEISRGLDLAPPHPLLDRAMVCGSPDMAVEMRALLILAGFTEGSLSRPGEFVVEKAFVDG